MSSLKRLARRGRSLRYFAHYRFKGDRYYVMEGDRMYLAGPFTTATAAQKWIERTEEPYVDCYDEDGRRLILF